MPVSTIGTNALASTAQIGSLTTASGAAPSYSARAWVSFNGTGTVAIRASGNVSSITDNGTGNYTVNFAVAMPSANYCVVLGGDNINGVGNAVLNTGGTYNASFVNILLTDFGNNSRDDDYVNVAVFR